MVVVCLLLQESKNNVVMKRNAQTILTFFKNGFWNRLVGTQALAMKRRVMNFFMLVIDEFFFATKARRHKVKISSSLRDLVSLWLKLRQFQIYVMKEK